MTKKSHKRIKASPDPSFKSVRHSPVPESKIPRSSLQDHNPEITFSLKYLDYRSDWCFGRSSGGKVAEILSKLGQFEGMTRQEVGSAGSHAVETYQLTKKARDRLVERGLDIFDELFSFRLSGKERVWALPINSRFFIVWWDPDHEICPSPKKHT